MLTRKGMTPYYQEVRMDAKTRISAAARELSKLGSAKGGKARAEVLSPEERQQIASEAATARWVRQKNLNEYEKILRATHGSPDRPLRLGSLEIPCYVLENGKRLVVQNGMVKALGIGYGGIGKAGTYRLGNFVGGNALAPFISKELVNLTNHPILFRTPKGQWAYGYEANVLADICEAVLEARRAGALRKSQLHIAEQCEVLCRGFTRMGIIALIDEATGYQKDRDRAELQKILEAYIAKELLPWSKRFPDEFYEHLFRLRGWTFDLHKGPRQVGQLTNHLIYEKLPPGVLDELRCKNPIVRNHRRKHKHFQFLTKQIGNVHLEKQLAVVITLMKVSPDWRSFEQLFYRAFPPEKKPRQPAHPVEEEGVLDAEFTVITK